MPGPNDDHSNRRAATIAATPGASPKAQTRPAKTRFHADLASARTAILGVQRGKHESAMAGVHEQIRSKVAPVGSERREHASVVGGVLDQLRDQMAPTLHEHYKSEVQKAHDQGITEESQQKRKEKGMEPEMTGQFFGVNPMIKKGERGATPMISMEKGQSFYHSTAEDWHLDAIKRGINTKVGLDEGRYKRGFYVTSDKDTGVKELANSGRAPKDVIKFESPGEGRYADVDKFGPAGQNPFTEEYNRGVAEWSIGKADRNESDGVAAFSKRTDEGHDSKNFVHHNQKTVNKQLGINPARPGNLNVIGEHRVKNRDREELASAKAAINPEPITPSGPGAAPETGKALATRMNFANKVSRSAVLGLKSPEAKLHADIKKSARIHNKGLRSATEELVRHPTEGRVTERGNNSAPHSSHPHSGRPK